MNWFQLEYSAILVSVSQRLELPLLKGGCVLRAGQKLERDKHVEQDDRLTQYDVNHNVQPMLAESWDISSDFTTLMNPMVVRMMGANIDRETVENVRSAGFKDVEVQDLWVEIFKQVQGHAPTATAAAGEVLIPANVGNAVS